MSKSRAKGTAAESAVTAYLRRAGWPNAERRSLNGSRDRGDVTGVDPGLVIEVKDHSGVAALGEWLTEARLEGDNALAPVYVVWSKARGTTDPGRWRVSMDGEVFVRLLAAWCGIAQPELVPVVADVPTGEAL